VSYQANAAFSKNRQFDIIDPMKTKALKQLLDRIPKWFKAAQDEVLRSVTEVETRYSNIYEVTDDDRVALRRSAEDVRKNRFATNKDVDAVFGRFHQTG
jgi:hypothetical protein